MKNLFFICLIFTVFHKSEGRQTKEIIWIKPPSMPSKKFKVNIQALGFPHTSYAQNQLKTSRKQALSFQLKEKLIPAQEFYLSGEEEKALQAFQSLSQMALEADWDEEERRIIIYAFLRQAQMERNPEKRKALLLSAIEFSLFKINSLDYPDYYLFPPPLLKEIQSLQEKANYLLVDWSKIFPNHEILLINGQRIEKNKKTKIPQAFYRISVFSSSYQSWSKKQKLSEILTKKVKTKALTMGFCNKMKIKPKNIKENTKLMPLSTCNKKITFEIETKKNRKEKRTEKNFLQAASLAAKSNHAKSSSEILTPLDLSEDLMTDIEKSELEKQNKFSNVPPWIIAGVGIVAVALIFSLSQNKEVKKTGNYVY